jgi:hypothetical protein
MDYIIVFITVIVVLLVFALFKKSEYNADEKPPEQGGIDADSGGEGDGGNGGS